MFSGIHYMWHVRGDGRVITFCYTTVDWQFATLIYDEVTCPDCRGGMANEQA